MKLFSACAKTLRNVVMNQTHTAENNLFMSCVYLTRFHNLHLCNTKDKQNTESKCLVAIVETVLQEILH